MKWQGDEAGMSLECWGQIEKAIAQEANECAATAGRSEGPVVQSFVARCFYPVLCRKPGSCGMASKAATAIRRMGRHQRRFFGTKSR